MNIPDVLHNNQLPPSEHIQHKWAFTNTQDSKLFSHRSSLETQSYRGIHPSPPVTIQGQVPNKPLLQQFDAYNLETVQQRLAQQSFTSNVALLRQFESYDMSQPIKSSSLDAGKDHVAVANNHYTSKQSM